MFTYYLCDDNDTIFKLFFSLDPSKKDYYLNLVCQYMKELVYFDEETEYKLVDPNLVEKENTSDIYWEDGKLFLEVSEVIKVEKLPGDLPCVVTVNRKKFYFLRPRTLCWLRVLLSKEKDKVIDPIVKKFFGNIPENPYCEFYFEHLYKFFFEECGELKKDLWLDYNSFSILLGELVVLVDTIYSANHLWWIDGDDADRCLAEGIINDARTNKEYLDKLPSGFFVFDEQLKRNRTKK